MIVVFFSLQTDYVWFWVDLAFSRNTLEEASVMASIHGSTEGRFKIRGMDGESWRCINISFIAWERDFIGTGRGHAFYTWL